LKQLHIRIHLSIECDRYAKDTQVGKDMTKMILSLLNEKEKLSGVEKVTEGIFNKKDT
jgi:hypothetical protein